VIFADSPEETQQAAYKFVRFLVSPEIQARWSANTGYFPVVEDALDDPTLVEAMEKIPALASANDQALSAGDDPNGLTPLSGVSASTPLADAWEEVYADGDPKQVLDKSAAEVTAQLKTYNEANPS
jgi:sn-glycerol 3-phosphate transport system substrate-binding protein